MKNFNLSDIVSVKEVVAESPYVGSPGLSNSDNVVDVESYDVDKIIIDKIYDKHGRLSDILDAAMQSLGVAALPLHAVHISSEVEFIQRYSLVTYDGVKYAMSRSIRDDVVDKYTTQIIQALTEGLSFSKDITKTVIHCGEEYQTYDLSTAELGIITSKFSNYINKVYVSAGGHLNLVVYPERRN